MSVDAGRNGSVQFFQGLFREYARYSAGVRGFCVAEVDPAVQQRVKNICVEQLQAQASGAVQGRTRLRPQKIKLVKVAFLGEIKQITLPGSVTGYELGHRIRVQGGKRRCKVFAEILQDKT